MKDIQDQGGQLLHLPTEDDFSVEVDDDPEASDELDPIIEAVQEKMLRIDKDLLADNAGVRVIIEIGEDGFCIEAEDF